MPADGVGILLEDAARVRAAGRTFERLKPRIGRPKWAALTVVLATIPHARGVDPGGLELAARVEGDGCCTPGVARVARTGRTRRRRHQRGGGGDRSSRRPRGGAQHACSRAGGVDRGRRAATVAEVIVAATARTRRSRSSSAMLSMHFILRNWQRIALGAQETFPLRPDYTAGLLAEFRSVGRSTLLGTIGTGVARGRPRDVRLLDQRCAGAALLRRRQQRRVASLVPGIGATLVWAPVGTVLILVGHPGRGILELIWGAVMVGILADYVIRPRLVGAAGHLPSIVTFAALLGGVQVFGLKGLIVGPVLMSLAIAVLRLYAIEARRRRSDLLAKPR